MNKNFTEEKLLSFDESKQIKTLYDLARFIEQNKKSIESNSYIKLKKYHYYLKATQYPNIMKLNKEFLKVKSLNIQFQLYLMLLERLHGQSLKEYDFLVNTEDKNTESTTTIPITIVLDSIRSAHNIGAILRNIECFGFRNVTLSGLSPTPEHDQVKKTSMGSHKNIHWDYTDDLINFIRKHKEKGYQVYGIETGKDAIDINEIGKVEMSSLIIFGHEQFGISLEVLKECDQIIKVPMYGNKNSLNVSVSSGIILNKIRSLFTND